MPPPMRTRQENFYQRQWGRHPGAAPIYTQGWAGAMTPDELTYEENRMEIMISPNHHLTLKRKGDTTRAPLNKDRNTRHHRDSKGARTESRSSCEEQYEARPQMKNKQKAQDKEPENEDEGINFIQAQLESLGIDASFTGFLKDPTPNTWYQNSSTSRRTDLPTNGRNRRMPRKEEPRGVTKEGNHSPTTNETEVSTTTTYQQPIAGPSMTRITSSQSDNIPRREPPLPYNEVAVPRGLGPKVPNNRVSRKPSAPTPRIEVYCKIPKHYPREQKIIPPEIQTRRKTLRKQNNRTNLRPMKKEKSGAHKHSRTRNPNEKRLRNQKNVDQEAKKARLVREGSKDARNTKNRNQDESLTP
ncbi:hypothetical protein BD779DRAFT_1683855 [Infundibulicybe gibba]|nr:hypothetical protein BD779DRAFT_1683855 [Infundibulicybe gibba]